MRHIARALDSAGRSTLNLGYPSGQHTLNVLAAGILENIRNRFGDTHHTFDFVGHSMGCILTRIIARSRPGMVRRAVMLAPPNRGSELVDRFIGCPPARWVMGPAGRALGAAPDSIPNSLGPPDFQTGIISGNKPDNPLSRFFIPGPEDGRVSVARTRLEGMADHLVVPHGHFFIMHKQDVIAQTVYFLENGCFRRKTA